MLMGPILIRYNRMLADRFFPESDIEDHDRLQHDIGRHQVRGKLHKLLGKPLRPEAVRFVAQLPKTRNAKILRRVIRGAYLGKQDLGDLSSLENPTAVDEIRALASR